MLKAKRSTIPGDTTMTMTAAHEDVTGRVWPAGTKYQPASIGHNNMTHRDEQVVSIRGERVTFAR